MTPREVFALLLITVSATALADIPPEYKKLSEVQKAALLMFAKDKFCGSEPVEADGYTSLVGDSTRWQATGVVYGKPYKSVGGICKAHVCGFEASSTKRMQVIRWKPISRDMTYMVWLSVGNSCADLPSLHTRLVTPIEENALMALLSQAKSIADQGMEWIRKNQPEMANNVSAETADLEAITIDESSAFRYELTFRGRRGLRVVLSAHGGRFIVEEAGIPTRP